MIKTVIITPVYCTENNNRLNLLEKTICSIKNQNYNLIHLIIDDDSPVDCRPLIKKISQDNFQLRYFKRKKCINEKLSPSNACNKGLEIALEGHEGVISEGEAENIGYFSILHSDDILPPKSVESRVFYLEKGFDLVLGNFAIFDKKGVKNIFSYRGLCSQDDFDNAIRTNTLRTHTIMFNKKILRLIQEEAKKIYNISAGIFDPSLFCSEDLGAILDISNVIRENNLSFKSIEEIVYFYRDNPKSVINEASAKIKKEDFVKHFKRHNYMPVSKSFLRPHAFLPENIKKYLRPVRDLYLRKTNNFGKYTDLIEQFI